MSKALYLYIDEAGNFDFSSGGSKFFIMTYVALRRPFGHLCGLSSIKYDCLEYGLNERYVNARLFHAAEDNQPVRNRVYEVIGGYLDEIAIYSIVVQKNKCASDLHDQGALYLFVFERLISEVLAVEGRDDIEELVVVTDSIPVRQKREALLTHP